MFSDKKCSRRDVNRTSFILGFLQGLWFVASFTRWAFFCFLACQEMQLCFHFSLKEQQRCFKLSCKSWYIQPVLCSAYYFSRWPTVSSNSSSSFLATNGHQPLILFCLKMETMGRSPSFVTISMVHCLGVFAPRGKRFRSSSIAPIKRRYLTERPWWNEWEAVNTWHMIHVFTKKGSDESLHCT